MANNYYLHLFDSINESLNSQVDWMDHICESMNNVQNYYNYNYSYTSTRILIDKPKEVKEVKFLTIEEFINKKN